ncbi:ATP-binding cassette domain-containing protein, partial [Vibrio cholerae]|nr:ATP-binding cassette domain-containing protein [Vibrio cholerae]
HMDRKVIDNVSLTIRRGEIVGIAGLMGAGRTELAMSLFGRAYGKNINGKIIKNGKEVQFKDVTAAINNGLAYVSEDRKGNCLILMEDIKQNI